MVSLVEERASQIVLGLDPDPAHLLPSATAAARGESIRDRAACAVEAHCRTLIEGLRGECVAVKLQLACFERLGQPGWGVLERLVDLCHEAGLLAIADGKRGDVPVSSRVYAEALFGSCETPWGRFDGLGADAATVNPYLGREALAPLIEAAARRGAGAFVLVRTSNPGASELQDLDCVGSPLHMRVAEIVRAVGRDDRLVGSCGLSGIGAVVGATAPRHMAPLREAMPRSIWLVPGVGAQGGRPEDLEGAFGDHPASVLVTASRTIALAHEETGYDERDPASAARSAARKLRQAVWRRSEELLG